MDKGTKIITKVTNRTQKVNSISYTFYKASKKI